LKKKDLITVYITNYNYGNYIDQCVQSILGQTYKNIEIIIIDDGSNDNSKENLKKYERNKKIKIIYQKNKGLNITNNIAIKVSTGRYIIRVDADDWLRRDAISSLYKEIKKDKKISMVFSNYFEVSTNGEIQNEFKRYNFDKVKILDKPAHGACSLIDKKKLLMVGGYNENLNCQDGYDIWFKFISKYKIKHINKSLFFYRQHPRSLSKNKKKILLARSKIFKSIAKKQKKINCLAVIAIRGPKYDNNSNVFKKLNNQNLIDWTLKELIKSSVNKIVIATPDISVVNYVKKKFKSKKIVTFLRSGTTAIINSPIDKIILNSFNKFKIRNRHYDCLMSISIEAPFRNHYDYDSMINVMKIFKTDSVVAVNQETDNFYKHLGSGLKILNDNKKLKLERNEIYRQVGKFYLLGKNLLKNNKTAPDGNIGHIVLDNISSFALDSEHDWARAKLLKIY
jgi:glycosyltransferase involved in cell wall biosynthesis